MSNPHDGKIELWRDYWDLGTLMTQAPKWWIESLAKHRGGVELTVALRTPPPPIDLSATV